MDADDGWVAVDPTFRDSSGSRQHGSKLGRWRIVWIAKSKSGSNMGRLSFELMDVNDGVGFEGLMIRVEWPKKGGRQVHSHPSNEPHVQQRGFGFLGPNGAGKPRQSECWRVC